MIDQEALKWLSGLGVGGILAGLMFFFYRKDALQWQDTWKGQSQILIQMVKENTNATSGHTAALAANTEIISQLIDEFRERRRESR